MARREDTSERAGREHMVDLQRSDEPRPYLVAIGASAGGLEALERFFKAMPADSGMAFVVIQHLSPDFKSLMDELLARQTRMPIHLATDGLRVKKSDSHVVP